MRLEIKPFIEGKILGFDCDNQSVYVGQKHKILKTNPLDGQILKKKTIPEGNLYKKISSMSRMWCRLMRYEIRGFGLTGGAIIAATKDGMYYCGKDSEICSKAHLPSLQRKIHYPIRITIDHAGRVVWGEYWGNSQRESVHLFVSDDGGRNYEVVKEFQPGEIRHIHSLVEDISGKGFWVLTGDENSESGIGWLSWDFSSFEWLVYGSQQYRAVVCFVFEDSLVYVTDTEKDYNFIYRVDKESGKTEKLTQLPGSCLYGCKFGKWYVVSTTVENFRKFKFNKATLWVSEDVLNWQQVWEAEKDIWHKKGFQYGSIILPLRGWEKEQIVFSGQALEKFDNNVYFGTIVE